MTNDDRFLLGGGKPILLQLQAVERVENDFEKEINLTTTTQKQVKASGFVEKCIQSNMKKKRKINDCSEEDDEESRGQNMEEDFVASPSTTNWDEQHLVAEYQHTTETSLPVPSIVNIPGQEPIHIPANVTIAITPTKKIEKKSKISKPKITSEMLITLLGQLIDHKSVDLMAVKGPSQIRSAITKICSDETFHFTTKLHGLEVTLNWNTFSVETLTERFWKRTKGWGENDGGLMKIFRAAIKEVMEQKMVNIQNWNDLQMYSESILDSVQYLMQ